MKTKILFLMVTVVATHALSSAITRNGLKYTEVFNNSFTIPDSTISDSVRTLRGQVDSLRTFYEAILRQKSDTTASYKGFGFNFGVNFDLLEGLKNSSFFSEVRLFEPVLRNPQNLQQGFSFLHDVWGASVAIRQSQVYLPKDNQTLSVTLPVSVGDSLGTRFARADIPFSRTIDMRTINLEATVFLPFFYSSMTRDKNAWSVSDDYKLLVSIPLHIELFNRKFTAQYETNVSKDVTVSYSDVNNQPRDTVIAVTGSNFKEEFNSKFTARYGTGVSFFLESSSFFYQLHLLIGKNTDGVTQGTTLSLSSSLYLTQLGGVSLGFRYWENRGGLTKDFTSTRPLGTSRQTSIDFSDEFEFYLVKYFSMSKFAEIFKF